MLENLTDRIGKALRNLRGEGKLTEDNMEEALREVRKALLSADVHFKVARDFIASVKEKCVGQEVLQSVTPGQQVVKIINDELVQLLGEGATALEDKKPLRVMLVGLDTAGRLQIDDDLIEEIKRLKAAVQPDETLLVADAALGQEAVNVAKHFDEAVQCTGIVLTKLDGDARGGAALSMKSITGVPIKFIGLGEKPEAFDRFHPERMASRILGMGDVVSLVEKAQETIDEDEAERMAEKMRRADFNLEDFLKQMQQVKKMGSLGSIVGMMPGMSNVEVGDAEEKKMARTEAIIQSMTIQERRNPRLMRGSRLKRVANGSGVKVRDVNALLKQFGQMQKMMKRMRGGKGKKMMRAMQDKMGEGGGMPGMPGTM